MLNKVTVSGVADVLAVGLAAATLFGFLGRLFWFFDLFTHFRVQYMQLCLVLIGVSLWKRRNRRAIALGLLAIINYAFVLPFYFGKPAEATEQPVRAMLMNLNASNGNTERVLKSIRNADPDLLLLEEVTPKWAAELNTLKADYPYSIAEPEDGFFGIMLLSKHLLAHVKIIEIGNAGVPSVTAVAYTPQGEVSVVGTHPVPPIGGEYSRLRNNQLENLPEVVWAQKYPVLLIGDLNTSPWSPHFKKLVRKSGLKNSMKGFGFQPTWPRKNPFMRIPIDHVLHAPEITIHDRMVGKSVGSDHYPVIVDFTIK